MKVILLTNILTPYRVSFYSQMNSELRSRGWEFRALIMADTEPERTWRYDDLKTEFTTLLPQRTVSFLGMSMVFNPGLQKTLAAERPDIVIAGGGYLMPSVLSAIKLRSKLKYRLIFWSESHLAEQRNYSRPSLLVREAVRHAVFRRFDGFASPGAMSRELIRRYARSDTIYFTLPNLVNEAVFSRVCKLRNDRLSIQAQYGIDPSKRTFLCPARLNPVKGVDRLVRILSCCEHRDNVIVLVAGEGDQRAELDRIIKDYGVDVRLIGQKTEEQMLELYAVADCLLLPSISDPNPLSCIEALWSGCALFVSENVGNYPEVVRIGENGFVFSHSREREAAELLDLLISRSVQWWDNARDISKAIASQNFSTPLATKRFVDELLSAF